MELHLKIIGFLLMSLALAHVVFPKYFNWKEELTALSLINREMMYVHTFFVALFVFLIGLLCWSSAQELVETSLGRRIALGLSIFWGIRLGVQFFGYSSKLWKGKKFESLMHVLFTLLWLYLTVVFFMVYWGNYL